MHSKRVIIEELEYISKPRINWELYAKVLRERERRGWINFEVQNRVLNPKSS